jgi:hypothetical protein
MAAIGHNTKHEPLRIPRLALDVGLLNMYIHVLDNIMINQIFKIYIHHELVNSFVKDQCSKPLPHGSVTRPYAFTGTIRQTLHKNFRYLEAVFQSI